jgi:translation elongation factor EF-Tu-like GTPase
MKLAPDFEGTFYMLPIDGRITPVRSGYRPQHLIHENYQTSGDHTYPDQEWVNLGDSVRVLVRFISPEIYPNCIWEGRVLQVLEGSKKVGEVTISRIFNEGLRVSPEAYKPVWIEPTNSQE